jgi:membrane protein implicated in regulation of membrane protease activity
MLVAGATDFWARIRGLGDASAEYLRLVFQAHRTWLIGAALAVFAAWVNVLPDITVPWWAILALIIGTLVAVQFQAFCRVREEREAIDRSRATRVIIDEIALLRTKETELRNHVVRDPAAYANWKAELVALRAEIHEKLERISRAEAETFHTVGNLKHAAEGGISDEHNLLLAVAARDIDHLADLIHGHTRFAD